MTNESEWIEHDGKGIPVDGSVLVLCKFRDGSNELLEGMPPARAAFWDDVDPDYSNWYHGAAHCGVDIVAYRVVNP